MIIYIALGVLYIIGFGVTWVFICGSGGEALAIFWPVALLVIISASPFIGLIKLLNWLKKRAKKDRTKKTWERKS